MKPVSRSTVRAFYKAFATRDPARIAPFLDDDIDWMISGPVDVLPFCGYRRGRSAVLEIYDRVVPAMVDVTGIIQESLLVDGDRAAMLCTLYGTRAGASRRISYRLAHFLRFRDDKIVEFRSILDSFDAAEQILGHAIDVHHQPRASDRNGVGDLIVF